MARRVYLHIGVMKSATSYLQSVCELNREPLREAGLLWCPEEVRYQAVKDLLARPGDRQEASNAWQELVTSMRQHEGDVLLSNELLAGLSPSHVARIVRELPTDACHVVITARDLAQVVPSHWQTTIKNGKTWSWSEFASSVCGDAAASGDRLRTHSWFWRRHDLPAIVTRWAQVVPVGQITLVTVPAETSDPRVVAERFGSVIGADLAGLEQPETRRNPSLGAHSVELLRRLNDETTEEDRGDPEHRYRRALGGALAASAGAEPTYALSQAQQDWVVARAHAMIDAIASSGVRVEGDLRDLVPAPSPPPDAVDPEATTEADLIAAAFRGLVGMGTVFNEQRSEAVSARLQVRDKDAKIDALEGRLASRVRRTGWVTRLVRRTRSGRTPR